MTNVCDSTPQIHACGPTYLVTRYSPKCTCGALGKWCDLLLPQAGSLEQGSPKGQSAQQYRMKCMCLR